MQNQEESDVELRDEDREEVEDEDFEEEESDDDSEETSDDEDDTDDEEDEEMPNEPNGNSVARRMLSEADYKLKLNQLEAVIAENRLQYQPYVDIIQLSRDNADLNKLREYREKMSEVYPLTESLWLDWLKDEQKFITTREEREKVNELFQRAVDDYLSVEIWLEFIQFSIGDMGTPNGVENVRNICEKAVSFAGLHVTKGSSLWEVYREFESALLAGHHQSCAGSVQTPQQTLKINEQIKRIVNIFERQVSVCLQDMESTLSEFKEFDESLITEQTLQTYEKSLNKYKEIESYEKALLNAQDEKKLEEYNKYIEFELKKLREIETGSRSKQNKKNERKLDDEQQQNELNYSRMRLKCLFERAIADGTTNCLDVSLWLKYIQYLNEEELAFADAASQEFNLKVFRRSLRNCPWSAKLWIYEAIAFEKQAKPSESIKSVFNQAMNAGLQSSEDYLQVWHSYLDYLRRSLIPANQELDSEKKQQREAQIEELRDTFQKAIDQQYQYFKHEGDPMFSLEKYWAHVEAKYFSNMEKCRKIYNEMVLSKGNISKYAQVWLEFYELEKQFGDEKHQRKLLNRAANELESNDEKEVVYEELLRFEKLNGNVHQFSTFNLKYQQFRQLREKELAERNSHRNVQNNRTLLQKKGKEELKKPNGQAKGAKEDDNKNTKKRKIEAPPVEANKKKSTENRDNDGFLIPSLPISAEAPSAKKPKKAEEAQAGPVDTSEFKNKYSNLTVFISNLAYDVDESKLENLFKNLPGFKELRLIKHWSGKTKGYGYVDFATAQQASEALKLDRTPIGGRPVFVSKNEDKTMNLNQQSFKYSTNLEKSKLFVSGLPFSTDKAALENMFKNFGKVKEVRIVTYKNGKSKGLAYVDFEDEQSASKALVQTDGMMIGEHQISVSISNPPKRKQPIDQTKQESSTTVASTSLGAGSLSSRINTSTTTTKTATTTSTFLPRSQLMSNRKKTLNL